MKNANYNFAIAAKTLLNQALLDNTLKNVESIGVQKCVGCQEHLATVVYLPCGHLFYCLDCHEKYTKEVSSKTCPSCYQPISGVKQIGSTKTSCAICTTNVSVNYVITTNATCMHRICIVCGVEKLRIALKNRYEYIKDGGLLCRIRLPDATTPSDGNNDNNNNQRLNNNNNAPVCSKTIGLHTIKKLQVLSKELKKQLIQQGIYNKNYRATKIEGLKLVNRLKYSYLENKNTHVGLTAVNEEIFSCDHCKNDINPATHCYYETALAEEKEEEDSRLSFYLPTIQGASQLVSISFMENYNSLSQEEIRFSDYIIMETKKNNKNNKNNEDVLSQQELQMLKVSATSKNQENEEEVKECTNERNNHIRYCFRCYKTAHVKKFDTPMRQNTVLDVGFGTTNFNKCDGCCMRISRRDISYSLEVAAEEDNDDDGTSNFATEETSTETIRKDNNASPLTVFDAIANGLKLKATKLTPKNQKEVYNIL